MIAAARLCIALLLLPGLSSPAQAPARVTSEVTFAQLTDAHIFDDGWKQPVPDALRQAANATEPLVAVS